MRSFGNSFHVCQDDGKRLILRCCQLKEHWTLEEGVRGRGFLFLHNVGEEGGDKDIYHPPKIYITRHGSPLKKDHPLSYLTSPTTQTQI